MEARSHANVTNTTQADSAVKNSLLKHAGVKPIEVEPKQTPEEWGKRNSNQTLGFTQDFSRIPVSASSTPVVQTKLVVGQPNDRYEQEADRVADQVMRMPDSATIPSLGRFGSVQPLSIQRLKSDTSTKLQRQREESDESDEEETVQAKFLPSLSLEPLNSPLGERIQRQADESGEATTDEEEKEEEEEPVQTKSIPHQTPSVTPDLASRLKVSQGMGQPLPSATREFMESRFNYDFSRVRVHTDAQANQMARSLNAEAFTHRQDIYFGAGRYQPYTPQGRRLLAHELTHTVQQQFGTASASRIRNLTQSSPPSVSQPSDALEQEAGTVADRVADGSAISPGAISVAMPVTQGLIARRIGNSPNRSLNEVLSSPPSETVLTGTSNIPSREESPTTPTTIQEREVSSPEQPESESPIEREPIPTYPQQEVVPPPSRIEERPSQVEERPREEPHRETAEAITRPVARQGGGGGAPVRVAPSVAGVSFTGEPSQMVRQFQEVSPVRAPFVFKSFAGAVNISLAARSARYRNQPLKVQFRPKAPSIGEKGASTRETSAETAPTHAELASLESQAPPSERVEPHQHIGSPAEVRGVEVPTRELDRREQQGEESFFDWARSWLRRFIAAIPARDSGINTNPGIAPQVSLTGRADPAQLGTLRNQGRTQIAGEFTQAEKERNQDFGETEIAPEAQEEELEAPIRTREMPAGPGCAPEEKAEVLSFDPDDEQELSERVRIQQSSDYETQRTRIENAERQRDRQIAAEEANTDGLIETEHSSTHRDQNQTIQDAQNEVRGFDKEWERQNIAIPASYEETSGRMERQNSTEIAAHRQTEENAIDQRFKQTRQRAANERERVEKQARTERSKSQQESGGWFTRSVRWVKNKIREVSRAVIGKIKRWFRDLRERIKGWFEELKAWAVRKIEQARRWVINKLENFRNTLNGLVDQYLGEFPRLANFFKRGINATINLAQNVVNAGAAALKTAVTIYLDTLATIIDIQLAIAEELITTGISFLCHTAILGFNLVLLAVNQDLDALIELIRDLPESPLLGPLWPIVKSGLLGFLERLQNKPPDEKKRFVKKIIGLVTSLAYYGGVIAGVVKGIIWDGLVGTLIALYDIVTGFPAAMRDMYNFFRELFTDIEAVDAIIKGARQIAEDIRAFINQPNAKEQAIAYLKRSPEILFAMVREAYAQGRAWARRAGAGAADALFSFVLNNTNFEIGLAVGTVIGQIIFEVLLLYFTAGIGTAIKVGAKALQVITRGLRLLTRGLTRGGGLILRVLSTLKTIAQAGVRAAQRLGGRLRNMFARLGGLLDRIENWFRRAFQRLRSRRGRGDHDRDRDRDRDRVIWRRFRAQVQASVRSRGTEGLTRVELRRIVERHLTPQVRRVVITAPIEERRGFYHVKAAMRPNLPRSIVRARRLPTGDSRHDPIPITWYKPPSLYPRTISLVANTSAWRQALPPANLQQLIYRNQSNDVEVPTRLHNTTYVPASRSTSDGRKWVTLGIRQDLWPRPGKVMHRIESPGRNMEGKFKSLLRNYGFNWSGFAPDHIQDLAWRGPDSLRNLWPLDSTANRRANAAYNQRVRYDDNGQPRTSTIQRSNMFNKWYVIRTIQRPP